MSCTSALLLLNLRGDILIHRVYRDEVTPAVVADAFRHHVINNRTTTPKPVVTLGSMSFMYMKCNDVYLLSVVRHNCNAMMSFRMMSSIKSLLTSYFGMFTEKSIKNNFVLIYELLDEVLDFGYPQLTDATTLKQYIYEKGVKSESEMKKAKEAEAAKNSNLTLQVTGKTAWRNPGIVHKKNEVYLDIIEHMSVQLAPDGSPTRAEVTGKLLLRVRLSGMPELRLGMTGRVEDCRFHQCVNLVTSQISEKDSVVNVTPPDGVLDLMTYRCTDHINVPFAVQASIKEKGRTKVGINMIIQSKYDEKLTAAHLRVFVPVPSATASADIETDSGKAKLKQDKKERYILWKVPRLQGNQTIRFAADVTLVSTTFEPRSWVKPPISMEFQLPQYAASGIQVTYLRVFEKSDYKVDKWVRKLCTAKKGDFLIKSAS